MQKITPCLWFDDQAEEAAKFYTSIFKNSNIGKIARYDKAGEKAAGRPAGSVMTIEFKLEGQERREIATRHASHAQNGQTRHRETEGGGGGKIEIKGPVMALGFD